MVADADGDFGARRERERGNETNVCMSRFSCCRVRTGRGMRARPGASTPFRGRERLRISCKRCLHSPAQKNIHRKTSTPNSSLALANGAGAATELNAMKKDVLPTTSRVLLVSFLALATTAPLARAANFIRANTATALNAAGAWTNAGVPVINDIAIWDSTVTTAAFCTNAPTAN